MSWLAANWVTVMMLLGSAGAGGVVSRLAARWLDHLRDKRKQTDDVAIDLVIRQDARIAVLEAGREADRRAAKLENQLCEANLSAVRHELRNLEGSFDGMLLALKHAPDKAAEIIAEVEAQRQERASRDAERRGELRNTVQSNVSAKRVIADKIAEAVFPIN